MSTADASSTNGSLDAGIGAGEMRLEIVLLGVSDVDRAKAFYESLGWRMDADLGGGDYRVVQLTPPGSGCSVMFGSQVTSVAPGSAELMLAVGDLEATRADLVERGIEVREVFHDAGGSFYHTATDTWASGRDPEGRSYFSFASFDDPDGNRWLLQEITTRAPGRV
jgi:catechol 2,3-dioxygenase-like lactoylglutathione lyase family enzyme